MLRIIKTLNFVSIIKSKNLIIKDKIALFNLLINFIIFYYLFHLINYTFIGTSLTYPPFYFSLKL